ncbi:MAG: PEP-CTERM sorting domain-containing protein [Planctomycetota bacterium]|nr:MAG: PEP-CTERM sorting domain-containing protein [Planctomycetota bacterium]
MKISPLRLNPAVRNRRKNEGLPRCAFLLMAAVSLLFTGVAKAGIITRDVNVTLNAGNIESYDLDVDLNGTTDFTFTAALVLDPILSVGFDVVDFPFSSNNGVVIDAGSYNGFPTASFLGSGDLVSASNTFSSASFDQGNLFFFTTFDPPTGHFNGKTGFLGIRFDRPGGAVFGFVEISVTDLSSPVNALNLTIGRLAFNDVPGQSIQIGTVPEPGSLALAGIGIVALALGANCQQQKTAKSNTILSGRKDLL